VLECVKHFFAKNKPVAAICHAAQILVAADVLQGKSCMAYPTCSPEITAAGGRFVEQNSDSTNAHLDGNLVTAAAWPGHPQWIKKFLDLLGTTIQN